MESTTLERRRQRRARRRRRNRLRLMSTTVLLLLMAMGMGLIALKPEDKTEQKPSSSTQTGSWTEASEETDLWDAEDETAVPSGETGTLDTDSGAADQSGTFDLSALPEELQELWEKNEEARPFVEGYEENKDKTFTVDLSEYADCDSVPLLMQWDERWGYQAYAGGLVGNTGCGPTCLSMAAIYLTGDTSLDPGAVADFATENGYSVDGSGSAWTLISQGAKSLGMGVRELPLDEGRMRDELQAGRPIICVLGPGDFTDNGHFIVLTGYSDGMFSVNDPNSRTRSGQLWSYDQLKGQIRNLWVLWEQ